MTRVVLDTNIIVSTLLQPLGNPAQVFMLAILGAVQPCVSGAVYAEYEDVISRPRFKRDRDIITGTLQTIREKSIWVRPTERIRVCSDPDDDIFLECAQAAGATYLVTGNLKHFPSSWQETKIITPRCLVEIVSGLSGGVRKAE
jgi:putative PIN family toxin of toxin-antitoxin system